MLGQGITRPVYRTVKYILLDADDEGNIRFYTQEYKSIELLRVWCSGVELTSRISPAGDGTSIIDIKNLEPGSPVTFAYSVDDR